AGGRGRSRERAAAPAGWTEVYGDADVLVVDKPAGLPVVALRSGGDSLDAAVRARHPGARPLHRIDRETSGLVLFTLTPAARKRLVARQIERIYLAVVAGSPPDTLTLDAPIGP